MQSNSPSKLKKYGLRNWDWVNTFYLSVTPIGSALLIWKFLGTEHPVWPYLFLSVSLAGLTNLAITLLYHRCYSHRAFEMRPWLRWVFLLISSGAFQGSALKWATDHRRHHRFVDTEADPYNINEGFFWAHFGWLIVKDDPKYAGRFEKDLLSDRSVAFQHRYYLPLALFMAFGVPTLIGWAMGSALGGLAFGGFLRLVLSNHATFSINSFCHLIGTQPYTDKNSARDSFVMAVFAAGEGYHNFHHKFQSDYRNGVRWYQFDPTKWMVAVCSWFGWTYRLQRTPASLILAARLEMEEKRLVERGLCRERIKAFREKVETAQRHLRTLREDYRTLKNSVQAQGQIKLDALRYEIKLAKAEFRIAWKQWCAYRRYPRLAPV